MNVRDDRTPEQKKTHTWLVVGTDPGMSGWGMAAGGTSYAVWACKPDDRKEVLEWVESRKDMRRVREVSGNYRPSGKGDCHIYVVTETHSSVARKYEFKKEMTETA